MLPLILGLVTIYAWWAPKSWLGRTVNQVIADVCQRVRTIHPLTVLCFVLVVAALGGLIAYGKFDGMIMSALAAPEAFGLFLAVDVGTAVEVLVVAWLAARSANLATGVRWLRSAGATVLRRTGRRRGARARRSRAGRTRAANDDDPAADAMLLRAA